MRQSTRLMMNTAVTMGRMVLTVGVGLLITRWLIQALGYEDFGIFMALGASAGLLTLLQGALVNSAQRHLAYDIGCGEPEKLSQTFNTALAVFWAMGLLILIAGMLISPWILWPLTIPWGREEASVVVFFCILFQIAIMAGTAPYRAIFTAHQELVFIEIMEIIHRIFALISVLLLYRIDHDRLEVYALLILGGTIALAVIQIVIALIRHPESRPTMSNVSLVGARHMFSFAGWSLFGQLTSQARGKITVLLLNGYFGPVVNGAFSIAEQVVGYQSQLTTVIVRVVEPAMTTSRGRGDDVMVRRMTLMLSRYALIVMFSLAVPVLLEIHNLLSIWIGEYPAEAPLFAQLLTLTLIMRLCSFGHGSAMSARGELRNVTLLVTLPQLAAVLVAVALVHWADQGPFMLPLATLASMVLVCIVIRPWYVGRVIDLPITEWIKESFLRLVPALIAGTAAAGAVRYFMDATIMRLALVGITYTLAASPFILWCGITKEEKSHFIRMFKLLAEKIGLMRNVSV